MKGVFPFILLVFSGAFCQPCEDKNSIDISDGKLFHDGSVLKDGVRIPRQYVYTKNVTGIIKTFGCICELKPCFRKCCPLGSVIFGRNCTFMPEYDNITNFGLNVFSDNVLVDVVDVTSRSNPFGMLYGRPCDAVYLADDTVEYLQKDGQLELEIPGVRKAKNLRTPDLYCVDTFVVPDETGAKTSRMDALVCFNPDPSDEHNYLLSSVCMLISCVFFLITLGVYAWLPELQNLYGKVLMAYLVCLLTSFLLLSWMQIKMHIDNISPNFCLVMTFFIYFSLLSAFFWLNVMCFDIYWTFSGKRGLSLEKLSTRGRFFAYGIYAFVCPTLLTILLAALEFTGLPEDYYDLLPGIKTHGCFISGKRKILYLYGPILILSVANITFFTLTTLRIASISNQTSVLQSKESATHDPQRKDKQRLVLYMKLFSVMGISWILEIVTTVYNAPFLIGQIIDCYNVLIGVIIFIIFVCKRKIMRLIKKRFKLLRGEPMSRTQTTMSSRTFSSRDDAVNKSLHFKNDLTT